MKQCKAELTLSGGGLAEPWPLQPILVTELSKTCSIVSILCFIKVLHNGYIGIFHQSKM
jgi:hypothetical protein